MLYSRNDYLLIFICGETSAEFSYDNLEISPYLISLKLDSDQTLIFESNLISHIVFLRRFYRYQRDYDCRILDAI